MLCPNCGKTIELKDDEKVRLCEVCAAAKEIRLANGQQATEKKPERANPSSGNNPKYAGFWMRFFANLIDGSLLLLITQFILFPLLKGILQSLNFSDFAEISNVERWLELALDHTVAWIIVFILVIFFVWFIFPSLLYAWCESSKYQATPGKFIFGLSVVGGNDERLGFKRAFFRNLGKLLSCLTLGIGYVMAGLTVKKQALHDGFVNTYVIRTRHRSLAQNAALAFGALLFYWFATPGEIDIPQSSNQKVYAPKTNPKNTFVIRN